MKGTHLQKEERGLLDSHQKQRLPGEGRGGGAIAKPLPYLATLGLLGAPMSHLPPSSQSHWVRTVPLLQPRRRAYWGVPAPHPCPEPFPLSHPRHSTGVAASAKGRRLRECGATIREMHLECLVLWLKWGPGMHYGTHSLKQKKTMLLLDKLPHPTARGAEGKLTTNLPRKNTY